MLELAQRRQLREFQAEKTKEGGTVVRVRLNLKLVRPALGMIVAAAPVLFWPTLWQYTFEQLPFEYTGDAPPVSASVFHPKSN